MANVDRLSNICAGVALTVAAGAAAAVHKFSHPLIKTPAGGLGVFALLVLASIPCAHLNVNDYQEEDRVRLFTQRMLTHVQGSAYFAFKAMAFMSVVSVCKVLTKSKA